MEQILSIFFDIPIIVCLAYVIMVMKKQNKTLREIHSAEKERSEFWKKISKEWYDELTRYKNFISFYKEEALALKKEVDQYKSGSPKDRDLYLELVKDLKNSIEKIDELNEQNDSKFDNYVNLINHYYKMSADLISNVK